MEPVPVSRGARESPMSQLRLSEAELSDTLQRAREIAEQSRALAVPAAECEALLAAGDEVGIPRDAIMQALRERVPAAIEVFTPGQDVWAPSLDGLWYPAAITHLGEHAATVRFVNGGEAQCALDDLRPLSLLPGRKLYANLPFWGWYGVELESYDAP